MNNKPLRGWLPILGTLAGGVAALISEAVLLPAWNIDLLMLVPAFAALVGGWLALLVERGLS